MKIQTTRSNCSVLLRIIKAKFLAGLLPASLLLLSVHSGYAGSATWNLSPASGDWNTATNWNPATVPNGPSDIATFAVSSQTAVSVSVDTEIGGIAFDPNANSYTITCQPDTALTVVGQGVSNNSGISQNVLVATGDVRGRGIISFKQGASAGDRMSYTVDGGKSPGPGALVGFFSDATAGSATFIANSSYGGSAVGGLIQFYDNSTAGDGTFINDASTNGIFSGHTEFYQNSSAGAATITNRASTVSGNTNGQTIFYGTATAGNATLINEGSPFGGFNNSGFTYFYERSSAENATIYLEPATIPGGEPGRVYFDSNSTAGNATIVAQGGPKGYSGGQIDLANNSTLGNARVILDGSGTFLWFLTSTPVSAGSIEGSGHILMSSEFKVGSNNLDTAFTGTIAGYGPLIKIGQGELVLAGPSTYAGNASLPGTTVKRGTLLVNNKKGSGTGTDRVLVSGGTLGGTGFIGGPVEIRSIISPGRTGKAAGTLTIRNTLTLDATSSYDFAVNSNAVKADEIVAAGVTIANGAHLMPLAVGATSIPPGMTFTVIDNMAATAIAGTFSNLPDGGTITVGSNTFQANYEGGDGNDLTLTVLSN